MLIEKNEILLRILFKDDFINSFNTCDNFMCIYGCWWMTCKTIPTVQLQSRTCKLTLYHSTMLLNLVVEFV